MIVPVKTIEGKGIGDIILSIQKERVPKRQLILRNIELDLKSSGDTFGTNEPFIVGKIGSFSTRTETCQKDCCVFKKDLKFMFNDEE